MHRLLLRQLRHILGIEDAGHWLALNQAIGEFSVQLTHDNPPVAHALDRIPALLESISRTYGQHERHLSLLRSSLETASREHSEAHEPLGAQSSGTPRSMGSLQGEFTRLMGSAVIGECMPPGHNRIQAHTATDLNPDDCHEQATLICAALAEDRFRLYAQEIRPLGADKDTYFEILLRLIDPSGEEIPPAEFMPAAERHKLLGAIDHWVISNTLNALASVNCRSGEIKVAINLAAMSLSDPNLADFLRQELRTHKVSARAIRFEVAETAAVSQLPVAAELIEDLARLGCKFALDNFACTNASFAHLRGLPVDYLKIDGRFVQDIVSDPVSRALVESINRIGQLMGKETIVTCVEEEEALRILASIGVDYAQGYAVSRPLPLSDWLATLTFADLPRSDAA